MAPASTNRLTKLLASNQVVVLDGAMGTELERLGHDLRHELWSGRVLKDEPAEIGRVHDAYIDAGADVILTASYQLGDDPLLLKRAVSTARAACERHSRLIAVGGSLGPYGACLADGSEYTGRYDISFKELVSFYQARVRPMLDAGVDFIAFETIPSLSEAKAVAVAIEKVQWGSALAWISFTCKDEARVASGDAFGACIAAVSVLSNVLAVGVNCTAPQHIVSLLQTAKRHTDKPLVAYPNRGSVWTTGTGWTEGLSQVTTADWVEKYIAAGARIVGGCCQTTPEDIRAISSSMKYART
jgi:homocysteine S-methyltransferase